MTVLRSIILLSAAICVLAGCASHGARCCDGAAASTARENLLQREAEWAEAMRSHEYHALRQIMGTDFRLMAVDLPPWAEPGSMGLPREAWLSNLERMSFGPIEMRDQKVTMHGERVATVRMHMTLHDWTFDGEPVPPEYELTDIWVDRDDRWQVVSRISEPVETGTETP